MTALTQLPPKLKQVYLFALDTLPHHHLYTHTTQEMTDTPHPPAPARAAACMTYIGCGSARAIPIGEIVQEMLRDAAKAHVSVCCVHQQPKDMTAEHLCACVRAACVNGVSAYVAAGHSTDVWANYESNVFGARRGSDSLSAMHMAALIQTRPVCTFKQLDSARERIFGLLVDGGARLTEPVRCWRSQFRGMTPVDIAAYERNAHTVAYLTELIRTRGDQVRERDELHEHAACVRHGELVFGC